MTGRRLLRATGIGANGLGLIGMALGWWPIEMWLLALDGLALVLLACLEAFAAGDALA